MKQLTPLSMSRVEAVRDMGMDPNGITFSQIRERLKVSTSITKHTLAAARERGMIECESGNMRGAKWAHPTLIPAIRAERDAYRANANERRRLARRNYMFYVREEQRKAKREADQTKREQERLAAEAMLTIHRVIRDARDAPPLAKTAPASVFELARFA